MIKNALYVTLLVLFAISCSRDSTDTGDSFTEPDQVEVQKVGTVQDAGSKLLARPGAVLPLPDGKFIVADVQTLNLHLYSDNFTHLHSIGGNGDGPGEFRRFSDYAVSGSDVIVFDGRRSLVSTFSTENNRLELTSTERFEYVTNPDYPAAMFRWFVWDENGEHIALYYDFNISSMDELKYHHVVAYAYDENYSPVSEEPIAVFEYTPELSVENNIVLTIPYIERGFVASQNGRILYANNQSPSVEIYDRTGTVVRTIMLPDFSTELTRDDKIVEYNRLYENSPDPDRFRSQVVSLMPDRSPVIRTILSDQDGRIWVRMHNADENADWYLFTREGSPIAKLNLPEGHFFRNASGNRIYTTNTTRPDPEIGIFEF